MVGTRRGRINTIANPVHCEARRGIAKRRGEAVVVLPSLTSPSTTLDNTLFPPQTLVARHVYSFAWVSTLVVAVVVVVLSVAPPLGSPVLRFKGHRRRHRGRETTRVYRTPPFRLSLCGSPYFPSVGPPHVHQPTRPMCIYTFRVVLPHFRFQPLTHPSCNAFNSYHCVLPAYISSHSQTLETNHYRNMYLYKGIYVYIYTFIYMYGRRKSFRNYGDWMKYFHALIILHMKIGWHLHFIYSFIFYFVRHKFHWKNYDP